MCIPRCVVTQRKTTFTQFWVIYPGLGSTDLRSTCSHQCRVLPTPVAEHFYRFPNVRVRGAVNGLRCLLVQSTFRLLLERAWRRWVLNWHAVEGVSESSAYLGGLTKGSVKKVGLCADFRFSQRHCEGFRLMVNSCRRFGRS
jgi:hypothetical protein